MKLKVVYYSEENPRYMWVEATPVPGVPGLAVHGAVFGLDDGAVVDKKRFVIAHIASGRMFNDFVCDGKSMALKAAKRLKGIADWTQSMEKIRTQDIADKVQAALPWEESYR